MTAANRATSCCIVGGGYAGVAAAIELHKSGASVKTTLFDPRDRHQKITQWHKLARGDNASRYETAFSYLARNFDFDFRQRSVNIDALLKDAAGELGKKYDAVIIAQGSHTPAKPPGMITLDALRDDPETQMLVQAATRKKISVIGGGPTGVQFAFEFAARSNKVTLYEARDRLLPTFDASLGITALAAAQNMGIDVRLLTEFDPAKDKPANKADLVLFVPGVRATPSFTCDVYGRVENVTSGTRFYAAGDNSYFSGGGLNTKSAQAAVRKAQHVARTLIADLTGRPAREYTYPELGYFVSLGPKNAVGYLLSQKTAFRGRAALFMKEMIEKQYDLFLAGLPVYP